MSRIRGPYVRFCERAEANLIRSPHPTRFIVPGLLGIKVWPGKSPRDISAASPAPSGDTWTLPTENRP